MAAPTATQQPGRTGSLLVRKYGPLPLWAWLAIGLAVIILGMSFLRGRTSSSSSSNDTPPQDSTSMQPIFIVPQVPAPSVILQPATDTVPTAPAGGGRDVPPGVPVPPQPPPRPTPVPTPTPAPTPRPPGKYQTVLHRYTTPNPAWDSTVSGMVKHYGLKITWQQVWNDPLNADLRAKRGQPDRIQVGDQVFLRGAK